MNPVDVVAVAGVLVLGVLALLFAFVWRALREHWALLLALSFAVLAVLYGIVASGHYHVGLGEQVIVLNTVLATGALVMMSFGLIDYVGVGRSLSRSLKGTAAGVGALLMVALFLGVLTRGVALPVWCAYLVGWALLFGAAMLREPRHGHGIVIAALMFYPLTLAAAVSGLIRPDLLNSASIIPFAVLGMTLLCTGLLRSHQRVALELAARERAEVELRNVNESLEQRVNLRTAELREVIDGLESFNRSISHDLRGPLGGIAGVAKLARNSVAGGDRAAADRLLHAIEAQAETSEKLVGALLALARASDAQLRVQRVDTEALVREVIESMRQARGVTALPVDVAPLPAVEADAELARQVFVNVLGNALKFSAAAPQPQVEVGVTGELDDPTFFVRDNGAGFESGAATRLFKPFHRLHGAQYEGFGVGLSIVKRIIDRHGGKVWAESSPGRGATFFFSFGNGNGVPMHQDNTR
jgi:signal transduction histidine kinase